MLTINLGPLALAVPHVLLLGSLFLAMLTGWWMGRRSARNPEQQLFRLLLVALVVARAAFVVAYAEHFQNEPWRVIDIRDGGFIAWPGLLVAVLLGGWLAWRDNELRAPLGTAVLVGVLSWGFGTFALHAFEQGTRLPEMGLRDSQGKPVALQDYVGKPLVVNLWATWCPPCRREMPVLAKAQQDNAEVTFLFVNQGEGERLIADFLDAEGLGLENVLLDTGGRLGQHVGSASLPTTLFYDAEGRQVGSHLGELSRASLARALEQLEVKTQP
ncbi:TlpA family protein disulfide reductase [Stutzerimonas zhaodongensis]|uniref:TlpA family protein disulfide reductase n=1 Tax=Stutzerimonas zhaodongensis TaxID=1176257 RepID=A0A365PZ17_9GAMM|nr:MULTISPECIES: TlpA disulfide reductase family protein [Pseudomonadaceae]NKQ12155.1 TlpA family protein disulfide reductase [Pseudomonas sp. SST3]RBA62180.1 TlpA family protein disulfide reductase [Stutzerimonas zhaodongensis]